MNAILPGDIDAATASGIRFSRKWTRAAIRILRAAALNPFISQKRHGWGGLNTNGHGKACANQVLIDLMDSLRVLPVDTARTTLGNILPITSFDEIVAWNDYDMLSFTDISNKLAARAGITLDTD